MMEKTLVILKPCTLQRGLVGEITRRFERIGLRLAGIKEIFLQTTVNKGNKRKYVMQHVYVKKLHV